jgi:hypothetical protein
VSAHFFTPSEALSVFRRELEWRGCPVYGQQAWSRALAIACDHDEHLRCLAIQQRTFAILDHGSGAMSISSGRPERVERRPGEGALSATVGAACSHWLSSRGLTGWQ